MQSLKTNITGYEKSIADFPRRLDSTKQFWRPEVQKNTIENSSSYSNLLRKSKMDSLLFGRMENLLRDIESAPSSPTLSYKLAENTVEKATLPPLKLQIETISDNITNKPLHSHSIYHDAEFVYADTSNSHMLVPRKSSNPECVAPSRSNSKRLSTKVPPPIITDFQKTQSSKILGQEDLNYKMPNSDSSSGVSNDQNSSAKVNFFTVPSPKPSISKSELGIVTDDFPVQYTGSSVSRTLPLIPTSPLIIQLNHVTNKISKTQAQMEKASTNKEYSRLETKLQKYESTLQKASSEKERYPASRSVSTIEPLELARVIAGFHWDMLSMVKVEEELGVYATEYKQHLRTNSAAPSLPRSAQSIIDFGVFLIRVVIMTIVTPYRNDNRVGVLGTWIKVANYLRVKFNDQQGVALIVEALTTPEIQCFTTVWENLRSDYIFAFELAKALKESHDNIAEESIECPKFKPMSPVIVNLRRLIRTLQVAPWDSNMIDALRSIRLYQQAYAAQFENRKMKVAHWLVLQKWLDEDQTKNYTQQYLKRTKQNSDSVDDNDEDCMTDFYALYEGTDIVPDLNSSFESALSAHFQTPQFVPLRKNSLEKREGQSQMALANGVNTVKPVNGFGTFSSSEPDSRLKISERKGSLDRGNRGFVAFHSDMATVKNKPSKISHGDSSFLSKSNSSSDTRRKGPATKPPSPIKLPYMIKENKLATKLAKMVFKL